MHKLTKNAIRCLTCGDTIESKTVHDFRTCRCGKVQLMVAVITRNVLLPQGAPSEWYEDLSEWKEL